MKIKKETFRDYITAYTEDENFYRSLYESEHLHPETFKEYLEHLDQSYIKRRQLYVPSLQDTWFSYISENEFFKINSQNIYIAKHNRYSQEYIHEHQFYELFYIYSGTCMNTIHGKKSIYSTGDLCIIPPKTKHSIAVFDDSVIINVMIKSSTFHRTFFELFTNNNVLSQFFFHTLYEKAENNYLLFHTGSDIVIRSLIEEIYVEYYDHEKYSNSLLDSYLMTFWVMLLRHHENHMESFLITTHQNLALMDILNYFQTNFMDISLSSAAEHFGFSVPHFSKLVKDNTGQTFVQLIRNLRIEKACRALKTTELSISSICEIVGYANPEHFNRIFKESFHMTPGEYRKNYKNL
ncbi:AraC family transcriptional regulator [Clostridium sp. E02]|uniref:AraC family transcriptional regulator n=1 Tax=Clostridium sp. E02 TaxID=2487134 RepID=UPI000F522AC3|nr:AraC family transcriptional regulator [Clostridium sp. E02]